MTTQQEISKIIADRYGNYKGVQFNYLKELHAEIRESRGDARFLIFLQQIVKGNPKPVFNLPDNFLITSTMKKYLISYDHTAGPNSFFVTSLEELSAAIDRLVEDPHVIQSSVKIETKEV